MISFPPNSVQTLSALLTKPQQTGNIAASDRFQPKPVLSNQANPKIPAARRWLTACVHPEQGTFKNSKALKANTMAVFNRAKLIVEMTPIRYYIHGELLQFVRGNFENARTWSCPMTFSTAFYHLCQALLVAAPAETDQPTPEYEQAQADIASRLKEPLPSGETILHHLIKTRDIASLERYLTTVQRLKLPLLITVDLLRGKANEGSPALQQRAYGSKDLEMIRKFAEFLKNSEFPVKTALDLLNFEPAKTRWPSQDRRRFESSIREIRADVERCLSPLNGQA